MQQQQVCGTSDWLHVRYVTSILYAGRQLQQLHAPMLLALALTSVLHLLFHAGTRVYLPLPYRLQWDNVLPSVQSCVTKRTTV